MRRHVIIGRYGANDRGRLPLNDSELRPARLGERRKSPKLWHRLSNPRSGPYQGVSHRNGCDVLVLATHVHAADTRVSRTSESQDGWTREIRLIVPVSEPDRWNTVAPTLMRLLNFLTGDRWTINFRGRPRGLLDRGAAPTAPNSRSSA